MRGLLVLIQYIYVAIALQTNQMERKISTKQLRDVTDPLNALMNGDISNEEFFASTGFTFTGTETKTKLNLYSPDCCKLEDCVDEINQIGKFWNVNFGRDIKLDLTMSITISIQTLANLSGTKRLTVDFNIENNFLVNIDESTKCEDLQNVTDTDWTQLELLTQWSHGLGFSEELVVCKYATDPLFTIDWSVVYIKFGGNFGVPESFGIFRRLMAYTHSKIANVVARNSPHYKMRLPDIWYYPTVRGSRPSHVCKLSGYWQGLRGFDSP
ncbi:unnamed protein product [Orchesella dallaii]|uniref:Uncharacterized protein n=1 Tax=Orchesella dallaii TaxID=48710 RepID=A0ABP1PIE2_9HEXA